MNEATAREHGKIGAQAKQTSGGWEEAQDKLALATDLALLLVAGHQPPALLTSNNNSICRALQSSEEHAHLCEPYCGKAFERASAAEGAPVYYRCHAGFNCFARTVKLSGEKQLAVIGGRAVHETKDYRRLMERVRDGDLSNLKTEYLFQNIIFGSKEKLDELAERIADAAVQFQRRASQKEVTGRDSASKKKGEEVKWQEAASREDTHTTQTLWPTTLADACRAALESLTEQHQLSSVALMLRSNGGFKIVAAAGKFTEGAATVEIDPEDERLIEAARRGRPLVAARGAGGNKKSANGKDHPIELYPLVVGDEIKGVLFVSDRAVGEGVRQKVVEFCREFAMPVEMLRLREELERRMRVAYHAQSFSEHINNVEPAEAYHTILAQSAELLRAERGSLLVYDEATNELVVKAALGSRAEVTLNARAHLGDGVAGSALSEGRPLVVRSAAASSRQPASPERLYKTDSYISYPIIVAGRKVGVLNVTDKKDGGAYDDLDLDLLEMIAPHLALALDRAAWHYKATQFQLLSITDPLTDLPNRRYLEERLSQELERSKRYRYAMSFMMIDVDDFKLYNDSNGHQAGDAALEMTAQALKSALRSADIPARYGGEEFSVLLPQTNLTEAQVIGERIRRQVERTRFAHGKSQPSGSVTISIGISTYDSRLDTAEAVIRAADEALFRAKAQGKNRVVTAASSPSTNNAA